MQQKLTHVDLNSFALKTNLANLQTEVKCQIDKMSKIDIAKLTPVPDDLAKLSNIGKKWCCQKD